MPRASKLSYYAVRVGRAPGIYRSWADCEAQVKGFTGALFKKLNTEAEAREFVAARQSNVGVSAARDITSVGPTSPPIIAPDPRVHATQNATNCDIVYCDGACRGNGQPGAIAGVGVWWGHGDPRNISERCPGDQTNNRAELIAIVRVLETTPPLKHRLLIKTDSHYSIQCVTVWISRWIKNGFLAADGKPVKNRALIKYLTTLLHARREKSQIIEFEHVRGHVGIEGNEAADQLASLGATLPILPERDWETLENRVLQSLDPVRTTKVVDDDLKAYASGLLDDDELAELADTSAFGVTLSESRSPHSGHGKKTRGRTFVSSTQVPPLPANATATVYTETGLLRGSSSRPARAAASLQSHPPKEVTTPLSRQELEMFASCALDHDELSTLGKNGVFDSDF